MIFLLRFKIYENEFQLKILSIIYKYIDIKYNTILLKNKEF